MRANIRTPQINEVLKDASWPSAPFVDVAKNYKFTQICKFKKADAHYLLGKLRKSNALSKNEDKSQTLQDPEDDSPAPIDFSPKQ